MRRTVATLTAAVSLAGLVAVASALAATPPKATTGNATAVNQHGAKLNGSVDPNGTTTTYYFKFGTTANYGAQTPTASAGSGTKAVNVSATLSGLAPGTTYHYRLVAKNSSNQSSSGLDKTFKTQGTPPSASRIALFGNTAFVSPTHVFGVFVGCIGQLQCTGSMRVTRSGKTIGSRAKFYVAPNDGGIVHLTLNATGRRMLAHSATHRIRATVAVTPLSGTTGGSSRIMTLVPFG
jgi:hypothetical protein